MPFVKTAVQRQRRFKKRKVYFDHYCMWHDLLVILHVSKAVDLGGLEHPKFFYESNIKFVTISGVVRINH